MTLQVGMVADDGIVIASDTLANRSPRFNLELRAVQQFFGTSKLRISEDGKVVVTCARDMIQAHRLAEALIAGLTPEFWHSPGQRMQEIAMSEVNRHEQWREAECLIALSEPTPSLYLVQCFKETDETVCLHITDYIFTGNSQNGSTFWAMRYCNSLSPELKRVESLIPLAAQIVVDGHVLNSGAISGLEIAVCDRSGVRRFTEAENRKQYANALKRTDRIKSVLFPRRRHS